MSTPSRRRKRPTQSRLTGPFLCGAVLAALMGQVGCTSVVYDSNTRVRALASQQKPDYASRTVRNLLASALGWAILRYPPPGGEAAPVAINLPVGLTREQYLDVAGRIGPNVYPISPETADLPTYHIGWVWMRGDKAQVDVFRPVYALSTPEHTVYQATTLHLRRRYASWMVEHTQPWEVGVVKLPPIYTLPEEPAPEQPVSAEPETPQEVDATTDAPAAPTPSEEIDAQTAMPAETPQSVLDAEQVQPIENIYGEDDN